MPYGVVPNLPRITCDNCGEKYQPKRPPRPGLHRFCKDNCKKAFHKRQGSFAALKPVIIKEVKRLVKERDPLDHEWQERIEKAILELQQTLNRASEAFNFRPELTR